MKNYFYILIFVFGCLSCDPDVAGEKITLPPVTFAFKVSNDTPYLRVGDTLNIKASISSTIDRITLTDGEGIIGFAIGFISDTFPIVSTRNVRAALNTDDYHLIINSGDVKWVSNNPNQFIRITGRPVGDSIIMDYSFIFLKPGVYQIGGFQSSFYEGTKGKGRWDGYFDVSDPHWWFYEVPSMPPPQPGDFGYLKSYLVAVTQ
jgi:hypothetical protein